MLQFMLVKFDLVESEETTGIMPVMKPLSFGGLKPSLEYVSISHHFNVYMVKPFMNEAFIFKGFYFLVCSCDYCVAECK